MKNFYENQMNILRVKHQKSMNVALSKSTNYFEVQIAKMIEERDAALTPAKTWQRKNFRRKSERNASRGDTATVMAWTRKTVKLRRPAM